MLPKFYFRDCSWLDSLRWVLRLTRTVREGHNLFRRLRFGLDGSGRRIDNIIPNGSPLGQAFQPDVTRASGWKA